MFHRDVSSGGCLVAAVRFAGDMQKAVTVKRGEIDMLQTKIRWLEECLDAALKVC